MKTATRRSIHLTVYELTLFAMFGAMMFASKKAMEFLPNMHLVGMFVILLTVVFRAKALIPMYIYVLLDGVFAGFAVWWVPYLYVWTVLWAVVMLLPRAMPDKVAMIVYPAVCCLHGLLFGVLYSPFQAFAFGLNFNQTIAWIAAGLPFDALHAVGNLFFGLLIVPLSKLLKKLNFSVERWV